LLNLVFELFLEIFLLSIFLATLLVVSWLLFWLVINVWVIRHDRHWCTLQFVGQLTRQFGFDFLFKTLHQLLLHTLLHHLHHIVPHRRVKYLLLSRQLNTFLVSVDHLLLNLLGSILRLMQLASQLINPLLQLLNCLVSGIDCDF